MQQPLIRRHTRQPLLSSHICASTRPSTCEHHHDMLRCMAKGWHAWHRYQWSATRAKRRLSRSCPMIAGHGSGSQHSCAKRSHAAFFSGSIFLRAVFNGDRDVPCCVAVPVAIAGCVPCDAAARREPSRRLSSMSRKSLDPQWAKFYLPVQRVNDGVEEIRRRENVDGSCAVQSGRSPDEPAE